MSLDWAMDSDEGEDLSLAILDAIEDEFHRKTMVVCQKTKGMRDLLNYDDASAPFWRQKGNAHMM
jgi:hypothetical protein